MILTVMKVVMAPLLVGGATVAQKRFGQSIGGRLVGLPLTSLPLLLLLTLSHGSNYGSGAVVGSLAGGVAQVALVWVFAWSICRWRTATATVVSMGAFAFLLLGTAFIPLSPIPAALLDVGALGAAIRWWPKSDRVEAASPGASNRTALRTAIRMIVAGAFTLSVCLLSAPLGQHLSGLLTSLPVLSIVMFAFTAMDSGSAVAREFALGVARGTYSVIASLAVLALLLPVAGTLVAFPIALVAALIAQFAPQVGTAIRELTRSAAPLLLRRIAA